jgi:hypothetical protein
MNILELFIVILLGYEPPGVALRCFDVQISRSPSKVTTYSNVKIWQRWL